MYKCALQSEANKNQILWTTQVYLWGRTNVSFVTANENPDNNYEKEDFKKSQKKVPFFSRNIPKLIEIRQVKNLIHCPDPKLCL